MVARHAEDEAMVGWLKAEMLPISHLEAKNDFDDLQPLKHILRGVKIVGLGEATHGTKEFFQLKHRLLEFLVTEMGYTAFSIESSHAACLPINNYVLHGVGDRDHVLTGQGYLAWSMVEFSALLDGLREWNQRASERRKVRFWGTDVTFNQNGRLTLLEYLNRFVPDRVHEAESLFQVLAEGEHKWPMRLDEPSTARVEEVLPDLDAIVAALNNIRDDLVIQSSAEEFDQIHFLLTLMRQWWTGGPGGRSGHMGRNLVHLIEREGSEMKVVYWGHNHHVGVETFPDQNPSTGQVLRQRYGNAYYACALEFGEGSYQTRIVDDDGFMGDFKIDHIGPAQSGSLPWYLTQVEHRTYFVDVRTAPQEPLLMRRLDTPITEHGGTGWAYGANPEASYEPVTVRQQYDGVAFVDRSTPTTPTASALEAAAKRTAL